MLDASAGILTQPKGSVPRISNLIGSKRGALRTCDGSGIVNAFNGVPTAGRGKALSEFFFEPAGVPPYYLRLMVALDFPLGPPQNLTVATAGGGTLPAATYFYKVTAVDDSGGETTPSNEISIATGANGTNTLTWNIVPNAFGYNVYRSTSSGTEVRISTQVLQPAYGALTVTFADTGVFGPAGATYNLLASPNGAQRSNIGGGQTIFVFNISGTVLLPSAPFNYTIAGSTPGAIFNGNYTASSATSFQVQSVVVLATTGTTRGGGGTLTVGAISPPISDTTRQTGLYFMPQQAFGPSYNNSNLLALYPAPVPPGGTPGGSTANPTASTATINGGVTGNINMVPQMVQFTNQAVIALGNGFPPQVFADSSTSNQATRGVFGTTTSISVDAFGVVTIVTSPPHGIPTNVNAGANVVISGFGLLNSVYNGTFPIIQVVNANTIKVRNLTAIGTGATSGGTFFITSVPIYSTFVPAFPTWTTAVNYAVNSIVVPTVSNGHFYKAVQGGTSGGSQPTFPTGTGQRVSDGQIIWQEAGLLNTAAPPPPGAAHVAVYSGSLWVFNTFPQTTATLLDGPTSLRMSDVNNMLSWNPINQAFLDKDDGLDGYGLASFTISAQGIPPEGSLIAFKRYQMYQITGVFGASNFAIQRALTDMGAIAPRTIQFIPGFGLGRLTHLGFGIFDGVNDRIISEPIRPYLFNDPNDLETADIIPMDQLWMSASQGAQTGNPPMAIFAIPVGSTNGQLTRICCYDLALKGWAIVDLPFPISTLLRVETAVSQVVSLMGSFSDGTLQRWQMGDNQWATASAGVNTPASVAWSMRIPSTAAKTPDERLYGRYVVITGQIGLNGSTLTIQPRVGGKTIIGQLTQTPPTGDFSVQAPIHAIDRIFDAIVSGVGQVTIDGSDVWCEPKPLGVLAGAIS